MKIRVQSRRIILRIIIVIPYFTQISHPNTTPLIKDCFDYKRFMVSGSKWLFLEGAFWNLTITQGKKMFYK